MRAPVNTLVAFNTLLDGDDLSTGKVKLYAREIKKALNNSAILLENLLNWSSSQMQGYKPIPEINSLKEISEVAVNTITDWASQKQITIKNNITSNAVVYADKNMTELIIRNILANAVKYTNNGGLVELNATRNGTTTTIAITDNGTGMNAMTLNKFNGAKFNYPNSSKPGTDNEKGSGLGLMLCKTFTELMDGSIIVKSEYGIGSTFFITLPAVS